MNLRQKKIVLGARSVQTFVAAVVIGTSLVSSARSQEHSFSHSPEGATISEFPYFEDFEDFDFNFGVGGSNSTWEWGVPQSDFISSAAEGARACVTSLDGSHAGNESSFLQSPPLDFSALEKDPTLEFQHIFQLAQLDRTWMEISLNGGPFQKLGIRESEPAVNWYNSFSDWWEFDSGERGQWRTARILLEGAAGKTANLRWVLEARTGDSGDGVGIDAVEIYETRLDVAVASIDAPNSAPTFSDPERVEVSIKNLGTDDVTGFPITLTVTGPTGIALSETFTDIIPPLQSRTHVFATPVDLSALGDYTFEIETWLAGDAVLGNNSKAKIVSHQTGITEFPYLETFELDDGGFSTHGTVSSWENGDPGGNFISSASSGTNAWVTALNGSPAVGEFSYLTSPPFDLSGFTHDPILRFRHIHELAHGYISWVEVSLNGSDFEKLGLPGDPASTGWYNDFTNQAWGRDSSQPGLWQHASHLVPGAAGKTLVIRWVLMDRSLADPGTDDGVGIDDVEVFEAPFGNGQSPQARIAEFEINECIEVVGFPIEFGYPGPYFSDVSASSDRMTLHFEGGVHLPVILAAGDLQPGAYSLSFGSFDLLNAEVIASGLRPGGLDQFFFTGFDGSLTLSFTIPNALVGQQLNMQAAILHPVTGVALTNAVQVNFVP